MDYFELFDLPVSLIVDAKVLTKKYYALSKLYHPDNFSLDNAAKQAEALEMSAQINQAKKTLSNADKRLAYILKEKGIVVSDEKYQLSPDFLGNMMDINEALMELQFDANPTIKEMLIVQIDKESAELKDAVKPHFEAEKLAITDENTALLKDYYYKKKYLDRIKEKL